MPDFDPVLARRIGAKVRVARTRAGMTRAELAQAIGISRQHVSAIENGKSVPGVAILAKLGDTLKARLM